MEDSSRVDVLFLGTIEHQKQYNSSTADKLVSQDELKFNDPVRIELLRIPHHARNLYNKITSKTQKQPIKSFEIYFRNLNKRNARYDIITSSSSELLVSSTSDILISLKEPIFTDLLVIRGGFTSITLCIYGRVITEQEEIDKKCPYFKSNVDFVEKEEPQLIKIARNVFEQSRTMVQAIEDEYSGQNEENVSFRFQEKFNDSYLHQPQIKNITSFSADLQKYEDLNNVSETQIAFVRKILQDIQTTLSKLLKSSHIGLYYPPGHRASSIPNEIPTSMVKTLVQLLSLDLSDQCRALEVLKMILQFSLHSELFVHLGGVESLIRLLIEFFSPNSVIFSSLKSLLIQVLITLSFWKNAAQNMVANTIPSLIAETREQLNDLEKEEKEKSNQRERSREKKRKKESQERSESRKKEKKSKKHKEKEKKKRSSSNAKDNKKAEQEKEKNENLQEIISRKKYFETLKECSSLYQMLFKIIRMEKNSKLLFLLRILQQQITQTLTKDPDLSQQIARYTPLLRDTKYMFNQGGEIIGNKSLKIFSSFKSFLNEEQSRGAECNLICDREKIKNPSKYKVPVKLMKMIDSATTVFEAKGEQYLQQINNSEGQMGNFNNNFVQYYDEQFLTLLSALISENERGIDLGINYFIDAIKIEELGTIKKNQAVLALIFQYLYQVFLECDEYTLVYYMDQIFHVMIKYVTNLGVNKQNSSQNTRNSSIDDKYCSKELKQKMNYLINLALPYNAFNSTENTFKGLTQTFIKLFSYEHFQISKITEYRKKQYEKSVNSLSFSNLSEAFNLGNFFELGPKQPLLEIDVCLKFFLVLLKFNRNIWTTFYEHKLVSAFSCLYLKIHSVLKFFLTPSLERQNVISEMKQHQRVIESYLRVAQDLTQIFIEKIKYESAFNELTEEQDIFDKVELYEKWFDTYLFLTNSLTSNDFMINKPKIKQKIEIVLAHIIEIFDTVLLSFEITKHSSRESKIKYLLSHVYKTHFNSISNRAPILAFFKDFMQFSGPNTTEIIKNFFASSNIKSENSADDVFLPNNDKSNLENLIRKNIYRSDQLVFNSLSSLIRELCQKSATKQMIHEMLDTILFENQTLLKEELDENNLSVLALQKNILCVNLLAQLDCPLSQKLDEHVMRYLKFIVNNRSQEFLKQIGPAFELRKLKLKNALLSYFSNTFMSDCNPQIFNQFIKISVPLLNPQIYSNQNERKYEQLKTCITILTVLAKALQNPSYQSILLYGENIENPVRSDPLLSLSNIFNVFLTKKISDILDELESELTEKVGLSGMYLICKLTTIDRKQFYSTESRKSAINNLISPERKFNLADLVSLMEEYIPKEMTVFLKNYIDFPIIERPQTVQKQSIDQKKKVSMGQIYSKSVFSMISENDPIGKTRFQFIQDPWEGGDVQYGVFKLRNKTNYLQYLSQNMLPNKNRIMSIQECQFLYDFQGQHPPEAPNQVFILKLKRNFTMKKNCMPYHSDITMKNNIPQFIKKPEQLLRPNSMPIAQPIQEPSPQSQGLQNMPSINNIPQSNIPQPNAPRVGSVSPHLVRGVSNTSGNRSPSPYNPNIGQQPVSNVHQHQNYQQQGGYPQNDYNQGANYRPSSNSPHSSQGQYSNYGYDQRYSNMQNFDNQRNYYQNSQRGAYQQQQPHQQQYQHQHNYNPRMVDPRMQNYNQPSAYQSGYNAQQYPPTQNYQMGYGGHQNYGQGYQNYPPQNMQNREIMLQESLRLIQHLKVNSNDLAARKRFEELLQDSYVKTKITDYLNFNKK